MIAIVWNRIKKEYTAHFSWDPNFSQLFLVHAKFLNCQEFHKGILAALINYSIVGEADPSKEEKHQFPIDMASLAAANLHRQRRTTHQKESKVQNLKYYKDTVFLHYSLTFPFASMSFWAKTYSINTR